MRSVICYVKSTLAAIEIDKQDTENYCSVYVEITHNNKKLILAIVYRPPKLQAADDSALYNEIQSLIQGKNAIVIGDFNCANVAWRLLIGVKLQAYKLNICGRQNPREDYQGQTCEFPKLTFLPNELTGLLPGYIR